MAKSTFQLRGRELPILSEDSPLDKFRRVPKSFGKKLATEQVDELSPAEPQSRREVSPPQFIADLIGSDLLKIEDGGTTAVLKRLRQQTEWGLTSEPQSIVIEDSLENCLPDELVRSLTDNVLFMDEPIPFDASGRNGGDRYTDPQTGIRYKFDAYLEIFQSQKKEFGDSAKTKLIEHQGEYLVVTEHQCGKNLRITQIVEAQLPPTQEYLDSLNDFSSVGLTGHKENFGVVQHLIIQDITSGKSFDARSILPPDWELRLRYSTENDLVGFSQDYEDKYVTYGNLKSPALIIGLFHEYGHNLYTFNDDPKAFHKLSELWKRYRMTLGGASSLSEEALEELKGLLVQNERGASAHAFQIVWQLKRSGLNLGIPIKECIDFVNSALANYERGLPGGSTRFIKSNLIKA